KLTWLRVSAGIARISRNSPIAAINATIRAPEPSDKPRNSRSPRLCLTTPQPSGVELRGDSTTISPEPVSAGFGVVTVFPSVGSPGQEGNSFDQRIALIAVSKRFLNLSGSGM